LERPTARGHWAKKNSGSSRNGAIDGLRNPKKKKKLGKSGNATGATLNRKSELAVFEVQVA